MPDDPCRMQCAGVSGLHREARVRSLADVLSARRCHPNSDADAAAFPDEYLLHAGHTDPRPHL